MLISASLRVWDVNTCAYTGCNLRARKLSMLFTCRVHRSRRTPATRQIIFKDAPQQHARSEILNTQLRGALTLPRVVGVGVLYVWRIFRQSSSTRADCESPNRAGTRVREAITRRVEAAPLKEIEHKHHKRFVAPRTCPKSDQQFFISACELSSASIKTTARVNCL